MLFRLVQQHLLSPSLSHPYYLTVTVHLALFPFHVVTQMVALPALTPVTTPLLETLAIFESLDDQVSFLGSVLAGLSVLTAKVTFFPLDTLTLFLSKVILLAATFPTFKTRDLTLPPALTVIVALPLDSAVTTPALSTTATFVLLDL